MNALKRKEPPVSEPMGGGVDLLRRTLQMAQSSLHRACLALGSTEGYREDLQEISDVLKRTAPSVAPAACGGLPCARCGSEHSGPKDAHCDRQRGSIPHYRPEYGDTPGWAVPSADPRGTRCANACSTDPPS